MRRTGCTELQSQDLLTLTKMVFLRCFAVVRLLQVVVGFWTCSPERNLLSCDERACFLRR
jgi:hypothetical protein